MTVLEIVLLIIGIICIIAGIFIPEKSKTQTSWEERKETSRIRELIEDEVEQYKTTLRLSLEDEVKE